MHLETKHTPYFKICQCTLFSINTPLTFSPGLSPVSGSRPFKNSELAIGLLFALLITFIVFISYTFRQGDCARPVLKEKFKREKDKHFLI